MIDYSQFTIGRVVRDKRPATHCVPGRLGHVKGFSVNEYEGGNEVIIMVRWCDDYEDIAIHPSNVVLL